MDDLATIGAEIKDFTQKAHTTLETQNARLLSIEQKLTAPGGSMGEGGEDLGATVITSAEFKAFTNTNRKSSGPIPVGSFHKSNLINATGLNQPLVQAYRMPGIVAPGQQQLTLRNLLPSTPIASNMVEFTKETSSTNAAAMQTAESVAKAESALGIRSRVHAQLFTRADVGALDSGLSSVAR